MSENGLFPHIATTKGPDTITVWQESKTNNRTFQVQKEVDKMSHEFVNGVDGMMLGSDKAAWHPFGTVVSGQPSAREAIIISGLAGWDLEMIPLWIVGKSGQSIMVPDKFCIVRTDLTEFRVLGTCGSGYIPVPNEECFGIADALVGQGGAKFETCGSLRANRVVFMTAVLPTQLQVGDDVLNKYLLITSSHDGTGAIVVKFTPVRVVCRNTLNMALQAKGSSISVRHTKSATDRMREAKRILESAGAAFDDMGVTLMAWAQRRVDNAFATAYIDCLYPAKKGEKTSTRTENIRNEVQSLFHGGQKGSGMDSVRGTAYGLYNAVCERTDWNRTLRDTGDRRSDAERRFEAATMKSGAIHKTKAAALMTAALENVDALVIAN